MDTTALLPILPATPSAAAAARPRVPGSDARDEGPSFASELEQASGPADTTPAPADAGPEPSPHTPQPTEHARTAHGAHKPDLRKPAGPAAKAAGQALPDGIEALADGGTGSLPVDGPRRTRTDDLATAELLPPPMPERPTGPPDEPGSPLALPLAAAPDATKDAATTGAPDTGPGADPTARVLLPAGDAPGRDAVPGTALSATTAPRQPADASTDALAAGLEPLATPGAAPATARSEAAADPASPALPAAATVAPGAFAAELARLMPSPPATDARGVPAELQLPVPVLSGEFTPRLGGEIAVLARNGVQEARVHLHPAELGPIAVQITLEGQSAQVHLAVDNALTRQILEAAMPALAGALRENGLTLTGGGVFEQPRQGPGAGDDPPQRRPGAGAGDDPGGGRGLSPEGGDRAAVPRARTVGALDLYA